MGMKKAGAKRKPIEKRALPTDAVVNKINENNGEAGAAMLNAMAGVKKNIEYASKDILLSDIETNPDNAIFRQADTEEDIKTLAEDIDRNGLMHNLVVFPQVVDGKTKYVLLSGERRYLAIKSLAEKGNANWNTIRNCHVVTSYLTENEKKVLLYSANLQVRGGFADEAIRRKAIANFVKFLQLEPYNMTEADAKKAIKTLAPDATKNMDKDLRVEDEEKFNAALRVMLDRKQLTRAECDNYVRLEPDQQQKIAECFARLFAVDCHDEDTESSYLAEQRQLVKNAFREDIEEAVKEKDGNTAEELLNAAYQNFESKLAGFQQQCDAVAEAVGARDNEAVKEMEIAAAVAKEETKADKKVKTQRMSFVQRRLKDVVDKVDKGALDNKNYKKHLKDMTEDERRQDVETLNKLIEKATQLRDMIESSAN